MKSFNDKSATLNALAALFSLVGFAMLIATWAYTVLFQWVFLPRKKWLKIFEKESWQKHSHYPNWFCYWLCTAEENMILHLEIMRKALDEGYCNEKNK